MTYPELFELFLQSEWYKSIPPADDPLRQRIEARILELKKDDCPYCSDGHHLATYIEIKALEQLLKPTT
jgi:hypothetical protein